MNKWFGHLKTVLLHKYWVFRYALIAGIPLRGLVHDLSKFSPTEFGQSVSFYSGKRSPIHYAREANSFSTAWLHHRG
ncbi:MAG: catalase, partial [Thermoguttaceae bacterium]|nr:catalase [Thermoguttaceae bacterium]